MKTIKYILLLSAICITTVSAQEENKNVFKISLSGFVKSDFIYDSRETVNIREGHLLLYPAPEKFDRNSVDINANPNFNILAIQSRLRVTVEGPEILGAKAASIIEGAFFGNTNSDINGFRLRHAFVKLDWKSNSLIAGQYWHPLFIEEVFPDVISFNTGIPFAPFSRNPQIRISQNLKNLKVSFTAASQRDFAGIGPYGVSSQYLRNSAVPIFNLNAKYISKNFVFGSGVNYQKLKPENETEGNYKSESTISSITFIGFAKYATEIFSIKLEGIYGQNTYDLLMLGGYAVSAIDQVAFEKTYTNIKTFSAWADISYGTRIKGGLFVGYSKNLGAGSEVVGDIYSRGSDINNLFRISPRVEFNFQPLKFAAEIEYTSAAYGVPNSKLIVENSKHVSNTRILTAVYYFFN